MQKNDDRFQRSTDILRARNPVLRDVLSRNLLQP